MVKETGGAPASAVAAAAAGSTKDGGTPTSAPPTVDAMRDREGATQDHHTRCDIEKPLPHSPSAPSYRPSQPIAIPRAYGEPTVPAAARQPSLSSPPGHTLKRAKNLLTASGLPSTPALQKALECALGPEAERRSHKVASPVHNGGNADNNSQRSTSSSSQNHSNPSLSPSPSLGIGASLRRTLSEVKKSGIGKTLKRNFSGRHNRVPGVNSNSTTTMNNGATKHARSFSEVGTYATTFVDNEKQTQRRSATFPLSSDISEDKKAPTQTLSTTKPIKPKMDAERRIDTDVKVPLLLQEGVPLTKISAKKMKTVLFRIDPDQGYIFWESKKSGLIALENIKEIRSGADARYYREQFQVSQEYESRWLTIVYNVDGRYKTLHVVAATFDIFRLWDRTLRDLHAVRQELMSGLGHVDARQSVWEKRYWRGADERKDDRLNFDEVEKMCRRLNLHFSKDDLWRRFTEADTHKRGFLDFDDFRKFVRLLKERPELTRLYKRQVGETGIFDFVKFEVFMRVSQESTASKEELEAIFRKYATPRVTEEKPSSESPPPPSDYSVTPSATSVAQPHADQQDASDAAAPTGSALPQPSAPTEVKDIPSVSPSLMATKSESTSSQAHPKPALSELNLTLEGFTNFLLSTDNSAFADQGMRVWQDMTRPLSEYYISSSHNTYLVGHQLVGVSTIEGYVRALLHSCRSVEIDIYDGDTEPVIYHGKTFTSKVPLRDICETIAKYAFVASPYPVIISAEVHCSIAQQDLIASIMRSVFGDILVTAPPEGRPPITVLPSPEDLKGRILLKAKNLYVVEREGLKEKKITVDTESSENTSSSSSTSDVSASDSEPAARDAKTELETRMSKARSVDAAKEMREGLQKPIKEIKEELSKARSLYDKVRRKRSRSPALASTALGATTLQSATLGLIDSSSIPLPSTSERDRSKVKMSLELLALIVYTVGVKCRGLNKKETYAPEHMFSLSERTANKVLKQGMLDLIKHNKTHLTRIYPNGTRLSSSNFEPHRFWAAGAQLVAINWQTFDLGYMINHSMFQRNGRAGYVLKPPALKDYNKELLAKRTKHILDLTIISAQQLPRRKDSEGREIINDNIVDPYVEVSIHVPDWSGTPYTPDSPLASTFPSDTLASTPVPTSIPTSTSRSSSNVPYTLNSSASSSSSSTARTTTLRTAVVKNNGFNPIWEEPLSLHFDCVGDMFDLIFLRFAVRDERGSVSSTVSVGGGSDEPLAVYCVSLGSLNLGYRHLPLHDAQLSQYLFSSLFVHVAIRDV